MQPFEDLPNGYKQSDLGPIPQEWELTRIGDLGKVVRGGSPRPAGDPRYFNGDFIPWLTVAALTNIPDTQLHVSETVGHLTEAGARHSRTLLPNTLIIANSGATLGVAKILDVRCCANDGIAAVINQHSGDKEFVCHYINSQTENLRDVVATGNGQPNLNTTLIREMRIPIPPLPEQRAIARALSDVDSLISALNALIAKKRAIKLATMQQLLTGRTRLPGFEGEWETKRLGEIADIDPEALSAHTSPDFRFNYISLEQVNVGRLEGFTEETFGSAPSRARRVLRLGDVLVSTVRPNLQSHLLYTGQVANAICSTGFAVVRPRPQLADSSYIFGLVFSDTVSWQIEKLIGGSNYPAITSNDVRALEVAVPSLNEQQAIGQVLSDMEAEIDALEARVAKTCDIKQGMMQQLLTGRIRLVSPNPEEVPA